METYTLLIYLFPLLFMIHEFEEIIFMEKTWNNSIRPFLTENYPRLYKRIQKTMEPVSTPAFTLAVAEEFLLVSVITLHALLSGFYYLWIGVFIAFSIHLVIHIIQWILIRKYIPSIVTSFLLLPYCFYGIYFIFSTEITILQTLLWSVIGIILTGINLNIITKLSKTILK